MLIDKDKSRYQGLKQTLDEKGYSLRTRETTDFHNLSDGQFAVINADSTKIVNDLLAYTTQPDTWAFYLIDPHGPSGIPYDFVKKVVSRDHHDVMINFIFEDLLRKGGLAIKDNLKPEHKQQVDNWTNAFGSDRWIEIARETLLDGNESHALQNALSEFGQNIKFTSEELSDIKEQKFVEAYLDVLYSMDKTIARKLVDLRFGDKERTMFYLFLTTHDATGALQLNRILNDAKFLEHTLRYRVQFAKKTAPPPGQMSFFAPVLEDLTIPEPEKSPRPTVEEIAKSILNLFAGQLVTKKDIYKGLANTLFFPEEVDKAIRYLRREKFAHFIGELRHKTLINISK